VIFFCGLWKVLIYPHSEGLYTDESYFVLVVVIVIVVGSKKVSLQSWLVTYGILHLHSHMLA